MSIVEGGVFQFKVVAKNKFGTELPVSDASVAVEPADAGSVSVGSDGSAGVFTSVPGKVGDLVLTPSAGGVTGTPFSLSVTADTQVVSVEIVEDTSGVATVEIVPQP